MRAAPEKALRLRSRRLERDLREPRLLRCPPDCVLLRLALRGALELQDSPVAPRSRRHSASDFSRRSRQRGHSSHAIHGTSSCRAGTLSRAGARGTRRLGVRPFAANYGFLFSRCSITMGQGSRRAHQNRVSVKENPVVPLAN